MDLATSTSFFKMPTLLRQFKYSAFVQPPTPIIFLLPFRRFNLARIAFILCLCLACSLCTILLSKEAFSFKHSSSKVCVSFWRPHLSVSICATSLSLPDEFETMRAKSFIFSKMLEKFLFCDSILIIASVNSFRHWIISLWISTCSNFVGGRFGSFTTGSEFKSSLIGPLFPPFDLCPLHFFNSFSSLVFCLFVLVQGSSLPCCDQNIVKLILPELTTA